MVVYPDGTWYSGVGPDDVEELVREHFGAGRPVARLLSGEEPAVRAEIDGNKKKMLAAFAAREEAGALPDDLRQAVNGFRESRVLLTAIELDVFTNVGGGADAATVAGSLGTDPRATEALLNALVAVGVLEKRDGIFHNTPVADRFLTGGSEHDSRAALTHTVHLWSRWSTLTECVRRGTALSRDERSDPEVEWTEAFIAAMHKNAAVRAPQVVRAIGLEGVRRVLDLGGGSGAYSIAFAQAGEDVHADVFDLESVVPITRRHIEEAGLADRVGTRVGDLLEDSYGTGYDLVFISAICHMLSPDENRAMLSKAFAALAPGGRVVIQDFILSSAKTAPKSGALFALNMLVGTRAGSAYSHDEYAGWLREAGFSDPGHVRLPGPTGLIVATRA
jgi:predicted O-methyltransferase YrrM